MSITCYFLLLNRNRMEVEVSPMIGDVLAGRDRVALQSLKGHFNYVVTSPDLQAQAHVQTILRLAIDTLEGRLTRAFVDEMTPPITDPGKAWNYNVSTLVRGGLVLSMCAERPSPEFSSILTLPHLSSELIAEYSPTTVSLSSREDAQVVEMARVGVFQVPEVFLRKEAAAQISSDLQPLLAKLPKLSVTTEIVQVVHHFYAFIHAAATNSDLGILRGYL